MSKYRSVNWVLLSIAFVWLALLSMKVVRQSYFIRDHELRLAVQIGMTLPEATRAWGLPPGQIWVAPFTGIGDAPKSFQRFRVGKIVVYGRAWPSSYLWVHLDEQGFVDRTFFIRS